LPIAAFWKFESGFLTCRFSAFFGLFRLGQVEKSKV
jgi:hypothetical protein